MTKIDIISGFLGAGKTTLIKKLLSEAFAGEQVVLIENEFGEIGIDGGFLKESGIEIREMNSGCICCSLVGDFGKSLREVVDTYHPDRILIEPSGVGKLSDVIKAVQDVQNDIDAELNGQWGRRLQLPGKCVRLRDPWKRRRTGRLSEARYLRPALHQKRWLQWCRTFPACRFLSDLHSG